MESNFYVVKVQLTDLKNESIRDPRFTNDFENLCWLQNQAKGPHFQCSKIMIVTLKQLKFVIFMIRISDKTLN